MNHMKSTFLNLSQSGSNNWWRYVLTILSIVAAIGIANLGIQQVFPAFKALFPENQFGKDLGTFILVGVVFGLALLAFSVSARKIHGRPSSSYLSVDSSFSWSRYLYGFVIWALIIFISGLLTDYDAFQAFIDELNFTHFAILFVVGFVSIGIQSFFEEFVIRGYLLQGLHLKIRKILVLVLVNSLIFGLLHFGYGIQSLLHSFTFGVAFAIIVMLQNRIEFVSGAHNANNLVLSLMFLDLSDATSATFSWSIDALEMVIHLGSLALLVGVTYKFFRS